MQAARRTVRLACAVPWRDAYRGRCYGVGVVGTGAFHDAATQAIYEGTGRTLQALSNFIAALDDSRSP